MMADQVQRMSISDNDVDRFWYESELSKNSKNFFNEERNTGFLDPSERVFVGEENTLEDFTERPQNSSIKSSNPPKISTTPNISIKSKNIPEGDGRSTTNPFTELSKKDAEINFLRRRMTEVPSTSTTVLRIVLGQSYLLEMYKSKEDKLSLLDEAISSHDGNAILVAVLFLERTMKPSLFNMEMSKRPMAVEHYLSYLQSESPTIKLPDALSVFNRTEQAAMFKFRLAISSNNNSNIPLLHKCLGSHFQSDPNLLFETNVIQNYINLLELQAPIQENDEREMARGTNAVLKEIPPSVSLIGTSSLSTLYYSCLYHSDQPENFLGNPSSVKKSQQLTNKQFIWKAVPALVRLRRWNQLDNLFVTKTWVGGSKMKSPIGFDRIVALLHHMSAPKDIKMKYCLIIDDVNKRIEVAAKYECHEVVLKAYKDMRDRQMIENYKLNLKHNSCEDYLASEILNDKSIKWKN